MSKERVISKKTASRVFWIAEFGVCFLADSSRWIAGWKLLFPYAGALLLSGLIIWTRILYYHSMQAAGWRIWLEYAFVFLGNLWWISSDHLFFYMKDGDFFISVLYMAPFLFLPVYNLGNLPQKHKKDV